VRRYDCLAVLAPLIADELVVTNVARTGFEWHALKPRDGNLYTMGMGLVTPLCLGLALALPHRRVVALDGDGSLLLNLGALATVANAAPPNLAVLAFDNQSYASTGGLPSATAGPTDLVAVARGAGFPRALWANTVEEFARAVTQALAGNELTFIGARVEHGRTDLPAIVIDDVENKYRFMRHLERLEGRAIFGPGYPEA